MLGLELFLMTCVRPYGVLYGAMMEEHRNATFLKMLELPSRSNRYDDLYASLVLHSHHICGGRSGGSSVAARR